MCRPNPRLRSEADNLIVGAAASLQPAPGESNRKTRTMARGLSREQSKEKNAKKAAGPKGNTENLSPAQRAERDKAAMAAKKAAKDAAKTGMSAEDLAAEEKRKAEQRARQKEGSFAKANPLLAKQLKKAGK